MTKKNPNLTTEQKLILFEEGTEPPSSSKLNNEAYGLAMLSYSSYITTLNRSVKFVWKNCKTNFKK